MCIYYKYTIYLHFFLGQTAIPFSSPSPPPCLMTNLFEGHFLHERRLGCIFLVAVVFSFCEMGNMIPRGKPRSENQSGHDPLHVRFFTLLLHELSLLSTFVVCRFVWWSLVDVLCTAEVKSCWLFSFFVDLSMGKETKSKWLDRFL